MTRQMTTVELVREIKRAGGCSHPIRLTGEFVNTALDKTGVPAVNLDGRKARSWNHGDVVGLDEFDPAQLITLGGWRPRWRLVLDPEVEHLRDRDSLNR